MILPEDIDFISVADWMYQGNEFWECNEYTLSLEDALRTKQHNLKRFLMDSTQRICRIGDVTDYYSEYRKIAKKKD